MIQNMKYVHNLPKTLPFYSIGAWCIPLEAYGHVNEYALYLC